MTTTDRVLLPRAESFESAARPPYESGIADLGGAKALFLDGGRPNANVVVEALQRLMEARFEIAATVVRKADLGIKGGPLPKEVFEKLVQEVDAAVVAIGS